MLIGLAWLPACQQQCQPPSTTVYQNVEDTPWRAISTTNPNVTITNFDFIVLSFSNDFTGSVVLVKNNLEYENPPIETFTWVVPAGTQGSGTMRIQYSSGASQDPNAGTDGSTSTVIATDDYQFSLSNQLQMTEVQTGYSWVFVPMVGIVDPDTNCTF